MDRYEMPKGNIIKLNEERDWEQFHSPVNLAKSVAIEAGELLKCFQWDNKRFGKEHVFEEIVDVFTYLINMVERLDMSLFKIADKRLIRML